MNVLCTADQDHQRWAIAVNNSNKFEDIYSMVNPLLMVYDIENGATYQVLINCQRNHQFPKKILLEIERKECKKLQSFHWALNTIRAGRTRAVLVKEMCLPENCPRTIAMLSENTGIIPTG